MEFYVRICKYSMKIIQERGFLKMRYNTQKSEDIMDICSVVSLDELDINKSYCMEDVINEEIDDNELFDENFHMEYVLTKMSFKKVC